MRTVFISYSHDSQEHREKVLALSERLRADGIETSLDRYVPGSPQEGWPRWMMNQLDAASFVLVVCTETYYRRFRGHEVPRKGKGVDWEGALITQEIYDSRSTKLRFIPILFSAEGEHFIPEPLRAYTQYNVTSNESYQNLYDFLLGQAGIEPGPIGSLKPRPRAKGSPLTFNDKDTKPAPTTNAARAPNYSGVKLRWVLVISLTVVVLYKIEPYLRKWSPQRPAIVPASAVLPQAVPIEEATRQLLHQGRYEEADRLEHGAYEKLILFTQDESLAGKWEDATNAFYFLPRLSFGTSVHFLAYPHAALAFFRLGKLNQATNCMTELQKQIADRNPYLTDAQQLRSLESELGKILLKLESTEALYNTLENLRRYISLQSEHGKNSPP